MVTASHAHTHTYTYICISLSLCYATCKLCNAARTCCLCHTMIGASNYTFRAVCRRCDTKHLRKLTKRCSIPNSLTEGTPARPLNSQRTPVASRQPPVNKAIITKKAGNRYGRQQHFIHKLCHFCHSLPDSLRQQQALLSR